MSSEIRPNVPGPCGGCSVARACCSDVRLTFTPDRAVLIPEDFLSQPNVHIAHEVSEGGLIVEVEGVCPEFDEETHKCLAYGEAWRSEDCSRFPLSNDGRHTLRPTCDRWHEFPESPVNQVVFDEVSGALVVR